MLNKREKSFLFYSRFSLHPPRKEQQKKYVFIAAGRILHVTFQHLRGGGGGGGRRRLVCHLIVWIHCLPARHELTI